MKVLVPVKRVVDFNVKVRVRSDGSGVDTPPLDPDAGGPLRFREFLSGVGARPA